MEKLVEKLNDGPQEKPEMLTHLKVQILLLLIKPVLCNQANFWKQLLLSYSLIHNGQPIVPNQV
jgi:hypothetical protein